MSLLRNRSATRGAEGVEGQRQGSDFWVCGIGEATLALTTDTELILEERLVTTLRNNRVQCECPK
jgi:hypothetical protein